MQNENQICNAAMVENDPRNQASFMKAELEGATWISGDDAAKLLTRSLRSLQRLEAKGLTLRRKKSQYELLYNRAEILGLAARLPKRWTRNTLQKLSQPCATSCTGDARCFSDRTLHADG